jgi:hypothetical protein
MNHIFICDQQYALVIPLDVFSFQNQMDVLLSQLRPNVVGIVDSFDFHDEILGFLLVLGMGRCMRAYLKQISQVTEQGYS